MKYYLFDKHSKRFKVVVVPSKESNNRAFRWAWWSKVANIGNISTFSIWTISTWIQIGVYLQCSNKAFIVLIFVVSICSANLCYEFTTFELNLYTYKNLVKITRKFNTVSLNGYNCDTNPRFSSKITTKHFSKGTTTWLLNHEPNSINNKPMPYYDFFDTFASFKFQGKVFT